MLLMLRAGVFPIMLSNQCNTLLVRPSPSPSNRGAARELPPDSQLTCSSREGLELPTDSLTHMCEDQNTQP